MSLPLTLDPHIEPASPLVPAQAEPAEPVELAARQRRTTPAETAGRKIPVSRQVRAAMNHLGGDAPTHRIQQWLAEHYQDQGTANAATLKSAISRERQQRKRRTAS
jgi:hypothetical protein